MKDIVLYISLLLGWLVVTTPKLLSAQTNQGSYVKVHFQKKGSLYFDYYDQNNHLTERQIGNKKNIDTTIVKHIDIDKPTVFRSIAIWKNKITVHKFIGFDQNDTIMLEATDLVDFQNKMSITYTIPIYKGKDNRMLLFNDLFGVSELSLAAVIPSIADYDSKKEAAENEKRDRLKRLTALQMENKIDSQSIQILNNYIDMCYYNQLLDVNYKNSVAGGWNHPDIERFDSVDIKNNLLLSINSMEAPTILKNLVLYYTYLNNRQAKTFFENVSLLNPRFYKTKLLTPFPVTPFPGHHSLQNPSSKHNTSEAIIQLAMIKLILNPIHK